MKTIKVKKLTNLWDKSKGLLGSDTPTPLYFTTRTGLHTFGMRFPIDVVILDHNLRVIKLQPKLLPFRFFFWPPQYNQVLELPVGTIDRYQLKIGDKLHLIFN